MSIRRIVSFTAAVPWLKRIFSSKQPAMLPTEEDPSRPLLKIAVPRGRETTSSPHSTSYGATDRFTSSPDVLRRNSTLGRVPEEDTAVVDEAVDDAEEIELELEEQGFYGGSYRRTVALYTFVPVTSLLVFILLALLPILIWPPRDSVPPPHAQFFPSPIPELLVSSALWSFTHLLRTPLYAISSVLFRRTHQPYITILFNILFVVCYNTLRLSAFPILRIRHSMDYYYPTWRDFAFQRVWWLALGWAATETVVGICQDYAQIALYRDVMIPEEQIAQVIAHQGSVEGSRVDGSSQEELLLLSPQFETAIDPSAAMQRIGSSSSLGHSTARATPSRAFSEALELEVERDIEQLMNLKEREEVEEVYGIPIIRIPVFVSCLQRIDSIIITVGIFLILSSSYLRSNMSLSTTSLLHSAPIPALSSNRPIIIALSLINLLNLFLCIIYTPLVLPRIGVHTTAYIGFLAGLGTLFAGLGLWGALS